MRLSAPAIRILMIAATLVICAFTGRASDAREADTYAPFSRGLIWCAQKDFARAEAAFRETLKRMPEGHPLTPAVRHHLGKALLGRHRFEEAIAHLQPLAELQPENGRAAHTLGLAFFFAERYEDCLPLFEASARLDPLLSNEALYYTGVAHLKLGRTGKGHAALQHLVDRAPESREARNAQPVLDFLNGAARFAPGERGRTQSAGAVLPGRPGDKPWSLFASAGMEYDDNVSLIPDATVTLPEGISSREAWRFVYSTGGSWEFLRAQGHRAEVDVSYSGTDNRHLSGFDVDAVSLGVPWQYNTAPFQLRLTPRISHTWVSSERYSWSWGLSPGLSYQPVTWTWTDLDYTLTGTRYIGTPPVPEEDRDALSHWLGLRQSFSFPDLILQGQTSFLSFGAGYDATHADGSSYDSDALGGSIVLQQGLGWGMTLLAQAAYREIHYDNPNVRSPEGEDRSDDETTASLRLFKKIGENLTLYTGYRRYKNDSNLNRFFEYTSDVVFFGLRFDL